MAGPNEMTPEQARNAVRDLRDLLENGYTVPWPPKPGSGQQHPPYDERVWPGYWGAQKLVGEDVNYLENSKTLRPEDIPTASASQLSTWFSWSFRAERFSTGAIAHAINNGLLLKLLERLETIQSPVD